MNDTDQVQSPARTSHSVPVLILGSYITALGAIRCLADIGVKAYCLTEQNSFVRMSRWFNPPPEGHRLIGMTDDLAVYLRSFPLETAVLMPCSDEWVEAVAGLPDDLVARFPSSRPSLDTLSYFLDKGKLETKLQELDIDRPKTFLVDHESDLTGIDKDLFSRLFMKPRHSRSFFLSWGVKAFHIKSEEDAIQRLRKCQECGLQVMMQEYVPGPADRHYFIDGFVDKNGSVKACFARQRQRMFPLDFGDSSYVTTVTVEQAKGAIDSLKRLLPSLNYRGIFSAEFKRDERDDVFRLIEVNTRPWTYIEFDARHGMNMAAMAYEDALGRDVPETEEYDIGASMVYQPNDMRACWSLIRRGDLGVGSAIASWFRAQSALFTFKDPMPFIRWWCNVIFCQIGNLFSRSRSGR